MSIADSLKDVESRIAEAAKSCGRSSNEIKLIAVTKTVEAERVNEAIQGGIRCIGENRVQEFLEKRPDLLPTEVHFIGALQSNKAKRIVGEVSLIHSLDRPSLLEAIEEAAVQLDIMQYVLIQVHIGDEDSKSGVTPDELPAFVESVLKCTRVGVRGLMCVPPPVVGDEARRYFAELRECRDRLLSMGLLDSDSSELSMGMSGDFCEAIMEGATMLRIGRSIFGER